MANVSAGETEFVDAFIKYVNNCDDSGLLGYNVSDSNRPVLLRGLYGDEILQRAYGLVFALDEFYGTHLVSHLQLPYSPGNEPLTYSRNNRVGSDFEMMVDGRQESVELKLGMATDGNLGFGVISKYLLPDKGAALSPLLDMRGEWREIYLDDPGAVEQSRHQVLYDAFQYYESNWTDMFLPEEGQRLMNGYADGITNADEIMRGYSRSVTRFYLKATADDDGCWWRPEPAMSTTAAWKYGGFELTDADRFVFWVVNVNNWRAMKFVLNYKNSYQLGDVKIDAKAGLGSPSYNTWWQEF